MPGVARPPRDPWIHISNGEGRRAMNLQAYDRLRTLIYDQSGIRLGDGKMSMVSARIAKRLRALQIDSELDYVEYVEQTMDTELVHLLDVISTNVTSFFREPHHFDFIKSTVGKWVDQGQKRFRFWSAASSTGEEPYTLAMTLQEVMRDRGCKPDTRILATDISTRVLTHAMRGVYNAKAVQAIDRGLQNRYFTTAEEGDDVYEVSQDLREMIHFHRLNLSKPPFPMKGPMDIILCRNVMIYFDNPVRDRLISEFHRLLRPDGYLIVGHAESLSRNGDKFTNCGPSIYQRVN